MEQELYFVVDQAGQGTRLDVWLATAGAGLTRTAIQHLCKQGRVTINDTPAQKKTLLQEGDRVRVTLPELQSPEARPEDIPLDILYEDECLLVINKPKGMVVHPAAGNHSGTMVNALLYHCGESLSGIGGVIRPGIVHRIDKDTSGLLVVAKNDLAHQSLAAQFKEHSIARTYLAVVYGCPKEAEGSIRAPIGRHPVKRKQFAVIRGGRHAVTHYRLVERLNGFSLLELQLETGRTHQIRVHMQYIGHPLAGDAVYGPKRVITGLQGQCLHAKELGFIHPVSGKSLHFDSEIPVYFQKFITASRRGS